MPDKHAWIRVIATIAMLFGLAALVVIFEMRLSNMERSINEITARQQALQQGFDSQSQTLQQLATQLETTNKALSERRNDSLPTTVKPADTSTIEDIYNPETKGGDAQSVMDELKKRYENILVNYLFLKRCNEVIPNDYFVIMAALSQEMASMNAPGRLQHDIISSAQGAYEEIYAKSDCKDAQTLKTQFTDYLAVLSKNALTQ